MTSSLQEVCSLVMLRMSDSLSIGMNAGEVHNPLHVVLVVERYVLHLTSRTVEIAETPVVVGAGSAKLM